MQIHDQNTRSKSPLDDTRIGNEEAQRHAGTPGQAMEKGRVPGTPPPSIDGPDPVAVRIAPEPPIEPDPEEIERRERQQDLVFAVERGLDLDVDQDIDLFRDFRQSFERSGSPELERGLSGILSISFSGRSIR